MKKTILLGALMAFGVITAQTKFGIKGGLAMSSISSKYDGEKEDTGSKTSFYVGALLEHKFDSKWALQGELLYADLGGKEEFSESYPGGSYKSDVKLNLGYLLVPISAKYYATEQLAVSAGLNFGFIMSAKTKGSASGVEDGESYSEDIDFDVKDDFNSMNLAPFLGLEYNFTDKLFVDTRYSFGMSNLAKDSGDEYTLKNSFFQIGVGFKF